MYTHVSLVTSATQFNYIGHGVPFILLFCMHLDKARDTNKEISEEALSTKQASAYDVYSVFWYRFSASGNVTCKQGRVSTAEWKSAGKNEFLFRYALFQNLVCVLTRLISLRVNPTCRGHTQIPLQASFGPALPLVRFWISRPLLTPQCGNGWKYIGIGMILAIMSLSNVLDNEVNYLLPSCEGRRRVWCVSFLFLLLCCMSDS